MTAEDKATLAKPLAPGSATRFKFILFMTFIFIGLAISFSLMRGGVTLTPESFRDFVLSLGVLGPVIYTAIFVVRPLFLIPSIALFVAGGLAFGPIWGPVYASAGSALGGALGFWIARKMGHDFVMNKLKLGSSVVRDTKFSFSVVFLLSLLPVMPVTAINYGAGLSFMNFRSYIIAFTLGITPRAFAYGFLGSTLLDIRSSEFKTASIILLVMIFAAIIVRIKSKRMTTPLNLDDQFANTK